MDYKVCVIKIMQNNRHFMSFFAECGGDLIMEFKLKFSNWYHVISD